MIRLEPRGQHSDTMLYLSPVLAVVLTLVFGMIVFAILGKDPVVAIYTFFVKPLTSLHGFSELLVKKTTEHLQRLAGYLGAGSPAATGREGVSP